MSESGGRRIRRDLYVDQSTIRFLEHDEIEALQDASNVLREYISGKESGALTEVSRPARGGARGTIWSTRRRLTNVGTFRAYIFNYLKTHPAGPGRT